MVNYKQEYLAMKLKYINAKNKFKGGAAPGAGAAPADKAVILVLTAFKNRFKSYQDDFDKLN